MEKQLRVLTVTLDYPPPLSGGYGVMCAQVCSWLKSRGHEVLVLTAIPLEQETALAGPDAEEGAVPVRRILRSYWDGSACLDLPFQEALTVEQHNKRQMQRMLATYHPDVVAFWHMGAMSLGLISTTARLGFPLVFVIGMIGSATAGGPMPGSGGATSIRSRQQQSNNARDFPHGCRTWEQWGSFAS